MFTFCVRKSFNMKTGRPHRRTSGGLIPRIEHLERRWLLAGDFGNAFQVGGPGFDTGRAVTTDPAGNVYVTGNYANSTADFDPGPGVVSFPENGGTLFVAKYTPTGSLVWARSAQGTASGANGSSGGDVEIDGAGNVLVTGHFSGTVDFDPGAGVSNLVSAGARDSFVLKLDPAGNFLWAKRMGGATLDQGQGVGVDSAGNLYATGFFEGSADFGPFILISTPTISGPRGDAFFTKLDGAGNFLWAKGIGGADPNGGDVGFDIVVDSSGSNYSIGGYRGTVDFDPVNVTPGDTLAGNGLADVFVVKHDSAGNLLWVRGFGDTSDDAGFSIALDSSSNVLATGFFRGTVDFDRTTLRPDDTLTVTGPGGGPAGAGRDVYVLKLTNAGNFAWVRSFGGVNSSTPGTADDADEGNGIAVDSADNVYTTGFFQNAADFEPGPGSEVLISFGGQDVFVSKLDSSGNFIYVRQLGGTDTDAGESIAVSSAGNIFVTGNFVGTADFDPSPLVFNLSSNGNNTNPDMFLTTLLPCSLTVTHTGDSGPGSLREAIDCANTTAGADTIDFQIPTSDSGFVDVDSTIGGGDAAADVFVIKPLSPLPALTDATGGTTIDGRTQTALGGDTNPFGPEIVLDGGPTIIENPTPASGDAFGISLADLNGNVLIGSRLDDLAAADVGAAYKFDNAGIQLLAIPNPRPATQNPPQADSFGGSDGVAAVGNNILVGAGADDLNAVTIDSGAAYLFDGTSGATLLTIDNPAPTGNGNFGKSVTAQGNLIVVGAPGNTPAVFQEGEVHMFDGDPNSTTFGDQLHVFANPDPQSQDFFGWSVATVGKNILVGARTDDTGATNAGIAYLFDGDPSSGTFGSLLATFQNPTPANEDQFGYDVAAVAGNKALIGTLNGEAAYLFDADPSSGTFGNLLATFNNPAPPASGPSDEFGRSVSAFGSFILVGAPGDDDTWSGTVTNAGSVSIFSSAGALSQTIFNPTPEAEDAFGFAVAQVGTEIVIGSIRDDAGGTGVPTFNAGAVYLYDFDANGLHILSDNNQVFDLNIQGFNGRGVRISGENNWLAGNYIGTDATGTLARGNRRPGVELNSASDNLIGTNGDGLNDTSERNVISANREYGVLAANSHRLIAAGNYMGTDASGMFDLGNGFTGIELRNSNDGRIGTDGNALADPQERNILSGNTGKGVTVIGSGNLVAGNLIGTDATGTGALGNDQSGVAIGPGSDNQIGGNGVLANTIAFNTLFGVSVEGAASGDTISGNSIHSNGSLGIDLGATGVTLNDPGDGDAGPNNLQNFPVIASVSSAGGSTTIAGSLNSTPSTTFTLEFFSSAAADPSGFGEGETFLGSTGVMTDPTGNVAFVVVFAVSVPAGHVVTATATDPGGNTSEFSGVETVVTNQPPTAEAGGPYPVDEGSMVTLDGSGSFDPDQSTASLTFEWDLDGDNIFGETGPTAMRGDETGSSPTFSAVGLDGPSTFVVSLRVTDDEGVSDTDAADIEIANVAPTIENLTGPIDPVDIDDQPVSVEVEFSDPGTPDTHDVTWDWGDMTTPDTQLSVTSPASQNHTYADPGVYTVTVTVLDDDGDDDEATFEFIVIYDPDGGFVTGGGWIDSPPGACTFEDCTVDTTGKANFGFLSKYKNGASVPTGQTEFQFKAGNLNFHSTSYDWLVIAGPKAMYKGDGRVNGVDGYTFQLNAIDGQISGGGGEDKFRIKIKETGGGVIYDNQVACADTGDNDDPCTELGGGSIKIHKQNNLVLDAPDVDHTRASGIVLTQPMLEAVVSQAIAFWAQQGATPEQLITLQQQDVLVADLSGQVLGSAVPTEGTIWIDRDGAGFGWNLHPSERETVSAPGVDLLSAVAHELGHVLGYEHDVLGSSLGLGHRELPPMETTPGDANRDGVFDHLDLIEILQAGKYLTGRPATWSQGDWNNDGLFDQRDIVAALRSVTYAEGEHGEAATEMVFAEFGH